MKKSYYTEQYYMKYSKIGYCGRKWLETFIFISYQTKE